MKTKLILGFLLCILSTTAFSQSPEKINYQAIIRDIDNIAVKNQSVSVKFTITEALPNGTVVYEETHNPTTNSHGLVNLKIGTGIVTSGTFNSINWGNNSYYLTSSIDPTGGSNYSLTGVSEMVSVPFALHAKTVDDKDDADADPNNEIQTLSMSGTTLTISGATGSGSSVIIPTIGTDADADPNNEIQDLQLGAHILKITNNPTPTGIDLTPYLDNTDTQLTEAEVDAYVANNAYLTSETDGSITNEIQTLSISGSALTISGVSGSGATVNLPSGGTDADADPNNEIQDLQLSSHILEITNNPTPTGIDLTPYLDNTDTQLTETEVDAYVANNGYLTTENDGSITNEIQNLSLSGNDLTISGGNTITLPSSGGGSTLKVGQAHEGGIIIHLNEDGISGLIVANADLGLFPYQSDGPTQVDAATDYKDGDANTTALVNNSGNFDAAEECASYTVGVYSDWFLPSLTQWILIYKNLYYLDGFFTPANTGIYWTSTQTSALGGTTAATYYISGSSNASTPTSTNAHVRPIRSF